MKVALGPALFSAMKSPGRAVATLADDRDGDVPCQTSTRADRLSRELSPNEQSRCTGHRDNLRVDTLAVRQYSVAVSHDRSMATQSTNRTAVRIAASTRSTGMIDSGPAS
jgi:hypothetical protein